MRVGVETNVAEMEKIVGEITTDLLFKEKPPRQIGRAHV